MNNSFTFACITIDSNLKDGRLLSGSMSNLFFLILKVEVCWLQKFSAKEIFCLNTVVNFSNMIITQRTTMTQKQHSCLTLNGKGNVGGK